MFEKVERRTIVAEDNDSAEPPFRRQSPGLVELDSTADTLAFATGLKAFDGTICVGKRESPTSRYVMPKRLTSVTVTGIVNRCYRPGYIPARKYLLYLGSSIRYVRYRSPEFHSKTCRPR